jgi:hypothetical protein
MPLQFLAALTRRRLIGGAGALSLLPVADRSAQAAAPSAVDASAIAQPLRTEFVLEVRAEIAPAVVIGPSSQGIRRLIPITGGSFEGPRVRGVVVPGGADWQLERPDGVTSVEAKYTLKASDGTLLSVTNRGIVVPATATAGAPASGYVRTVPEFEVPSGTHDWLNRSIFVGSLDATQFKQGRVIVRVFRVI